MTFGSLFSGIGGLDLGLERAGLTCQWQVEIDPFCQKVLAKHWPHVKRYGDITQLDGRELERVDLLAGGSPCVDISAAGKQAGIDAPRSGLWFQMLRIIRPLRPQFVLIENVAALLVRGIDRVLSGLAESGFDAEWQMLSACTFGAPHTRFRMFIVAYPVARDWKGYTKRAGESICNQLRRIYGGTGRAEPEMDRLANGFPRGLVKPMISGLGNAVVPQVAEWIGRRILEAHQEIA